MEKKQQQQQTRQKVVSPFDLPVLLSATSYTKTAMFLLFQKVHSLSGHGMPQCSILGCG